MRRFFNICVLVFCCLLYSCIKGQRIDGSFLNDYVNEYLADQNNHVLLSSDSLALYVDYSTCISQGQESSFFQHLQPTLVAETKEYWSIKGTAIRQESGSVFELLRNVVEVNYAAIEEAVKAIVQGQKEAILLTDGEFYEKTIARGHINDPYLQDEFATWLQKGYDIYILSEPYTEVCKGRYYEKKRYYFIFTDSSLENNIYTKLKENSPWEQYVGIGEFHLSASGYNLEMKDNKEPFIVTNEYTYPLVNCYKGYETQSWQIKWKDIEKYIMYAVDPDGNPQQFGDPVFSKMKIDRNAIGGYELQKIEMKVSILEGYGDYYAYRTDTSYVRPEGPGIVPTDHFLVLQDSTFSGNGEFSIYFEKPTDFWPTAISEKINYIKVDILPQTVVSTLSNGQTVIDMFTFDSIDKPGDKNTSILESIRLCLNNPDVKSMIQKKPIYTIYIEIINK